MTSVEIEGRLIGIDIDNPSEKSLRELEEAWREVQDRLKNKGGKLVVQPTASGLRLLRVKEKS